MIHHRLRKQSDYLREARKLRFVIVIKCEEFMHFSVGQLANFVVNMYEACHERDVECK